MEGDTILVKQQIRAGGPGIGQLLINVALAAAWGVLLLAGIYAWPVAIDHDLGSRVETMSGVYRAEANDAFSYAYTNGDATLRLPQLGSSQFAISIRMGGPGASVGVPAQLFVNGQARDLGEVSGLRTYDLAAAPDAQGDITLRLQSGTARLGSDPRALGLLLDRITVRAMGSAPPPFQLTLSMLLVLALGAAGLRGRGTLSQQRVALLALASVLALLCWAGRGNFSLTAWWAVVILIGVIATVMQLSRMDGRVVARPLAAAGIVFAAWRVMMWCFAALGLHYSAVFAPIKEVVGTDNSSFAGVSVVRAALADAWVHWDSTAYVAIATTGYTFRGVRWPSIAFFPLYPLLSRWLSLATTISVELAAVLIAQVAFFGALLVLYDLVSRDFGTTVAYRTLILLIVCPTSFFFAAAYTESITLLLLVAAVWAIRRGRWWLAGGLGFLLTLARLPGVLIAPILVLAYLHSLGWRWRAIRAPILAAALPPLALALFMVFQWQRFGTPFAFMIAQQSWDNRLSPPWVLPQALYEHIFVYDNWPLATVQALFWIVFLVLTIGALLRLPWLYSLTLLFFLLPPYLSSWPWSVSRHVLLGFPAFIVLAQWTGRVWVRQLLVIAMIGLLALLTALFVNGVLVA
jgi:hypothetical protein